jgi:hypothetical protein
MSIKNRKYIHMNTYFNFRMRKDLFDVLKKFNETNNETLDKETRRYLERSITEGKQDGKLNTLN